MTFQRMLFGTIILGALCFGLVLAANRGTTPVKQDQPATKPAPAVKDQHGDQEVIMVTGRLVDAFSYLTDTTSQGAGELKKEPLIETIKHPFPPDAPIALLKDETGVLEKLVPGRALYLIIFDMENTDHLHAYSEARNLIDKEVHLTGKLFKRDGMEALSIYSVIPAETTTNQPPTGSR